ncbi:glycosyl transferase family protein [Sphingomonas sp.]|uniref:glycosyl transferase family protein n=1 Tax=Sphingomonas sp. TaxID=28214 RepID=UPI0035BC9573
MIWFVDSVAREAMLFAAVGLLIGGLDDIAVDAVYWTRRLFGRDRAVPIAQLPAVETPGRMAVFVPAWDEAAVIGDMLAAATARFRHPDYRIYVGLYPNDPATIEAVVRVARRDPRVHAVIGARDGPTTKADCLNTLWHALRRDDRTARAVVLHDAEDVVHPDELTVFDALLDRHAVVQLPVVPLIAAGSLVSGVYADEFAESHGRNMVVRVALGAGMPLAGVGCAIRVDMLGRIATARGGDPFDADSLTEDYELGMRVAAFGGCGTFAQVIDAVGEPVAVRAYFPADVRSAVRQKARWMIGIALAGWDRIGWARWSAVGDHWMRAHDRRAPLAVVVLAAAYVALLAWPLSAVAHVLTGTPAPAVGGGMTIVLAINAAMLLWRLASRSVFTTRAYGFGEGLLSLPRFVVGNIVALMAARRAVVRYVGMLRGRAPVWDKTQHVFPDADVLAQR